MKNIFKLSNEQLKEIAQSLQSKVEKGLSAEKQEIQCIPTFITPSGEANKGKALVLDLGGTNYRVAVVDFSEGKPSIHPENGWKKDLSIMKTPGFKQDDLFKAQADPIFEIKLDEKMPIGYCFSYPAESMKNGDAKLLYWTKGVDIPEMVGKPVGESLVEYLNAQEKTQFTKANVINDTVASLFAGLAKKDFNAYIGLIVGTGTNMATFVDASKITKLGAGSELKGLIPINLESGNFFPPHLTPVDDMVDATSSSKGAQRFEKAVSGMYLGEIFKSVFLCDELDEKFDAQSLTHVMNNPGLHEDRHVCVARWIYERSAALVAASLAGLILELLKLANIKEENEYKVCLTAEGSLFWSQDKNGKDYNEIVLDTLHDLLAEFGYKKAIVHFNQMDNANLIGSAIAALS